MLDALSVQGAEDHQYRPGDSYVRFSPEEVAHKIRLLNEYIHALGDGFSQEKLEEREREVNREILASRASPKGPLHEAPPLPVPRPTSGTASCRPPEPEKQPLNGLSGVKNWTAADIPLLWLSDRWLLATDGELQWVLYRRQGSRWVAEVFPTHTDNLIWHLSRVPDLDPEALAKIRGWPRGHFNQWRIAYQEK